MNWLQRQVANLTARAIPNLRETLELARQGQHQRAGLLIEAETLLAATDLMLIRESNAIIQLEIEEREWQRLTSETQQELSHYHRSKLIQQARWSFLKNPLVKRGVRLKSEYVFGRGVMVESDDEATKTAIGEFLQANASEFAIPHLIAKEQTLQTDGNLFLALFSRETDGATQVRRLDALEITEIITDPGDRTKPWFYRRVWRDGAINLDTGVASGEERQLWYPSLEAPQRADIAGVMVAQQPVYHAKLGGLPEWLFGLPDVWSALAWARSYKDFMENWATREQALSRFALTLTTKGGQKAMNAQKAAIQTTVGTGVNGETNPAPVVGSTFIAGTETKLAALKSAGSSTAPDEARRIGMMATIGLGFAENMGMGDVSTGSLATSLSMDRPTELMCKARQEQWKEILTTVIKYALSRGARAPGGRLREARDSEKLSVIVNFPEILEHDVPARISAARSAASVGGKGFDGGLDPKTYVRICARELGEKDPEAIADAIYPDASYDPADYAAVIPSEAAPDMPELEPVVAPPRNGNGNRP